MVEPPSVELVGSYTNDFAAVVGDAGLLRILFAGDVAAAQDAFTLHGALRLIHERFYISDCIFRH